MNSILIRHGSILKVDEGDDILTHGDVFIRDSQIEKIGPRLDISELNPDFVIEAKDKLIMPGLVNSDFRSKDLLCRGHIENIPQIPQKYRLTHSAYFKSLPPELVYVSTIITAIEMLKTGTTMVQDDAIRLPFSDNREIDAIGKAYDKVGMRANLVIHVGENTLHKSTYSRKESLEYPVNSRFEDVIENIETILANWQEKDSGRIRIAISPHSINSAQLPLLVWIMDLSERLNIPLHFHIREKEYLNKNGLKSNSCQTTLEQLSQFGLLTARSSITHLVSMTQEDIEIMARSKVCLIHTPINDLYMGNGIVPMHNLLTAGVNVALGTGSEGDCGNLNMFEVMKMTISLHRISQPSFDHWVKADQVLQMATLGGARSCLIDSHTFKLSVGQKADLVLLDLKSTPFTHLNDIKSQLVCLEDGGSVDTVIVDGKVIIEGRRVTTVNEEDIFQEFVELSDPYLKAWTSFPDTSHRFDAYDYQI